MSRVAPKIRMQASGGRAEVYIYDTIVSDPFFGGISSQTFRDELKSLGDVEEIALHVNSRGGSVFEGQTIYNLLKDHAAKVTAYIDGLAASIASVIVMAADEIRIAKNAHIMIHRASAGIDAMMFGDADEMRKVAREAEKIAALLENAEEAIIGIYADRTGASNVQIREWMNAETWFMGQKAVDAGFADVVTPNKALAACLDLSGLSNVPESLVLAEGSKAKEADVLRSLRLARV